MKASSHDRLRIDFDAPGLVANAGLVLPATLAQHWALPALLRQQCVWARWTARHNRTR